MGEEGADRTFPGGAGDDRLPTLAGLRLLAFVPEQVNFRSLAQGCDAVYRVKNSIKRLGHALRRFLALPKQPLRPAPCCAKALRGAPEAERCLLQQNPINNAVFGFLSGTADQEAVVFISRAVKRKFVSWIAKVSFWQAARAPGSTL